MVFETLQNSWTAAVIASASILFTINSDHMPGRPDPSAIRTIRLEEENRKAGITGYDEGPNLIIEPPSYNVDF